MTVEEYFQLEANDSETRYEYIDGHVYAMAAGDHQRQRERHEVQRDPYVLYRGLDTCLAGEEDNQEIRMRVLRALFAIYCFSTESGMDLDEDIPSLLMWQGICYLPGRKEHGKKTKAVGV